MTIVTGFAAGYMCRVLAARRDAVMTRSASANDLCVVNRAYRHPYIGVVAVFADICCLNMREVLTGSSHAIMAVAAVINDFGMVEVGR